MNDDGVHVQPPPVGVHHQQPPAAGVAISVGRQPFYCKRKKKRFRTAFTGWQLAALEAQFRVQQYLVGEQRVRFAEQLGLGPTQVGTAKSVPIHSQTFWHVGQVKVWFQNRRIRFRREQRTAKVQRRGDTVAELPKAAATVAQGEESANASGRMNAHE